MFQYSVQVVTRSPEVVWLLVWLETVFLNQETLSDVRLVVIRNFAHHKLAFVNVFVLSKYFRLVAACVALSLFRLQSFAKRPLVDYCVLPFDFGVLGVRVKIGQHYNLI